MTYMDLDEVDQFMGISRLWSRSRLAPVQFRPLDYFDGQTTDLANGIRDLVESKLGFRPEGSVRMLTHLRTWWWLFNPITLYWCFDGQGDHPVALVAEVSNTPWKERTHYVVSLVDVALSARMAKLDPIDKQMHVSPFFGMNQQYVFGISDPDGESFKVTIDSIEDGRRVFNATLSLTRLPATPKSLRAILFEYPAQTLRLSSGIYLEALKLWRRGASYVRHPNHRKNRAASEADKHQSQTSSISSADIAVPGRW
jgi:hypothetical protein